MTEEKGFITLVPGIVWMESDGNVWQCLDESFGLNVEKFLSDNRGRIFSCVRPFYEQAVSDLDWSMHRSLWV